MLFPRLTSSHQSTRVAHQWRRNDAGPTHECGALVRDGFVAVISCGTTPDRAFAQRPLIAVLFAS